MPKSQDELEKKRKSYLKKMLRLGEDLTALRDRHRKREKKIAAKRASYEAKLKKVDDRIPGP
jgi:predicted  nucleic acid-binding Zn-ribbon protein